MVLEISESTRKELMQELEYYGSDRLARMLGVLGNLTAELRTSTNPRLSFEIALTRMVRPESDLTLEALAERIEELERRTLDLVGAATPAPASAPVPEAPVPVPTPAPVEQAAPAPVPAEPVPEGFPVSLHKGESEPVPLDQESTPQSAPAESIDRTPAASNVSAAEQLKNPAALQRIWHTVLASIKKEKAAYGVLFLNTKIIYDETSQKLDITFPPENVFAYSAAQKPEVYDAVSRALNQAAGSHVAFSFLQSEGAPQAGAPTAPASGPAPEPVAEPQPAPAPAVPQATPGVQAPPSAQVSTPEAVEAQPAPEASQAPASGEADGLGEDEIKDMLTQEYGDGVIFGFVEEE